MAVDILIVDDSAIVRRVLIKTIKLAEFEVGTVHEAENGQVALDVLQDHHVDLVFLDINMPVMNGMEFMDKLSEDEKLRDTPVIVVSTEGSKERKEQLFEKNIKAYLRKPVTPESLNSTVQDVLKEAGK